MTVILGIIIIIIKYYENGDAYEDFLEAFIEEAILATIKSWQLFSLNQTELRLNGLMV